jgi:hypothetical protein
MHFHHGYIVYFLCKYAMSKIIVNSLKQQALDRRIFSKPCKAGFLLNHYVIFALQTAILLRHRSHANLQGAPVFKQECVVTRFSRDFCS